MNSKERTIKNSRESIECANRILEREIDSISIQGLQTATNQLFQAARELDQLSAVLIEDIKRKQK